MTWVNYRRMLVRIVGILSLLALAGCGSSTPPASSGTTLAGGSAGGSETASTAGLQLSRLDSLTNYTFSTSSSGSGATYTITGKVHGPTDWETVSTAPAETTYDVGGQGYGIAVGHLIHIHLKTPEGLTHLDGEQASAEQLAGYTHVTGIKITKGGSCTVASVSGTTYNVQSPNAATLNELATACVANTSGALLSYSSGVKGGSAANAAGISGISSTFRVDSIGDVGQIDAPRSPPTTTASTTPSKLSAAPGLPSSFPSQIPSPPGKVVSGTQTGPGKWYVQLTEKSSSAFANYVSALKSKGFSVTGSTSSSGIDIEDMASPSFQILLEQTSFPGQGEVLAVTVKGST
ncbi:MAG: hypothetical protein ACYDGY_10935 [Acidimicrobiales bacterium]